jgi:hypothetical protein
LKEAVLGSCKSLTPIIVWSQDNHREAHQSRVTFKFLDDRLASVRLLVKNHCIQASAFDRSSDLGLCIAITPVDDEDVVGELGRSPLRCLGRGVANIIESFLQ